MSEMRTWATLDRPWMGRSHVAPHPPEMPLNAILTSSIHASLPAPIVKAASMVASSRVISGHPLRIFNVPQVVNLTYPASLAFEGSMLNNFPVNRTDFRLVRGVTNEIIFFVRDVDRKPVSLSVGDSLTINIVDPATDTLLMTRDLTLVDLAKGIYKLATLSAEMDTWPTGPLRWSILCNRDSGDSILLWTDLSYSPYSNLHVTAGPIPGPAPTATIVWADFSLLVGIIYVSGSLPGAAQYGYLRGAQTFVYAMGNFTGTVGVDATLVAQPDLSAESPDWFSVESVSYTGFTGNDTRDLVGNYLWLRIVVTPASGSFLQAQYKV